MSIMNFPSRYLFRGIGIVLLIGMLTILLLAIYSQPKGDGAHHAGTTPAAEKRTA